MEKILLILIGVEFCFIIRLFQIISNQRELNSKLIDTVTNHALIVYGLSREIGADDRTIAKYRKEFEGKVKNAKTDWH